MHDVPRADNHDIMMAFEHPHYEHPDRSRPPPVPSIAPHFETTTTTTMISTTISTTIVGGRPTTTTTTVGATRRGASRVVAPRRGRRERTTAAASFFNRGGRARRDEDDDDDEDDDGVYYGEDDEDEDDASSKRPGMSLDVDDAMASFNETAGGFVDKIKSAMVSQTVDLDVVEVVEEDVYERPKRGGFGVPNFGSFGGSRSTDEEEEEEVVEEASTRRRFGFGGGRKKRDEAEEEEEEAAAPSGLGAILAKNAARLDRTRAILDQDLEKGVAARSKVREGRAGGKAVSAIIGDKVGDGSWTLTAVADEGSQGKRLPSIKIKRGESKIIGRSKGPGVDVAVPLPCVSGVHCEIETDGNKLYITDLGSTNGTYVEGFEVKKNRRFRIFNGAKVRLGAENFNGEPYATFKASLAGAKELEKDSEYGQLNYFIEFLGGPKVVVNFLFINFAFQLTFFLILQLQ
jgi:hypothetical protein